MPDPNDSPQLHHMRVHFVDGTMLEFTSPPQTEDELGAAQRLSEYVARGHLSMEVEGRLLVFPLSSVKYLEGYPIPSRLPSTVVRGAKLVR